MISYTKFINTLNCVSKEIENKNIDNESRAVMLIQALNDYNLPKEEEEILKAFIKFDKNYNYVLNEIIKEMYKNNDLGRHDYDNLSISQIKKAINDTFEVVTLSQEDKGVELENINWNEHSSSIKAKILSFVLEKQTENEKENTKTIVETKLKRRTTPKKETAIERDSCESFSSKRNTCESSICTRSFCESSIFRNRSYC